MSITIPDVVHEFASYYERHPAWGAFHVILADGNTQQKFIPDAEACPRCGRHARRELEPRVDQDQYECQACGHTWEWDYTAEETRLLGYLQRMSRSQRARLPRKVDEYLFFQQHPEVRELELRGRTLLTNLLPDVVGHDRHFAGIDLHVILRTTATTTESQIALDNFFGWWIKNRHPNLHFFVRCV